MGDNDQDTTIQAERIAEVWMSREFLYFSPAAWISEPPVQSLVSRQWKCRQDPTLRAFELNRADKGGAFWTLLVRFPANQVQKVDTTTAQRKGLSTGYVQGIVRGHDILTTQALVGEAPPTHPLYTTLLDRFLYFQNSAKTSADICLPAILSWNE